MKPERVVAQRVDVAPAAVERPAVAGGPGRRARRRRSRSGSRWPWRWRSACRAVGVRGGSGVRIAVRCSVRSTGAVGAGRRHAQVEPDAVGRRRERVGGRRVHGTAHRRRQGFAGRAARREGPLSAPTAARRRRRRGAGARPGSPAVPSSHARVGPAAASATGCTGRRPVGGDRLPVPAVGVQAQHRRRPLPPRRSARRAWRRRRPR